MNVICPSCHKFYEEKNYSPGGVRRCPNCQEILYLPMEAVPEAYLAALDGENAGQRIPLTGHMIIGRSKECEIYVQDQTLSRQHAGVVFEKGEYLIKDMGSRNGIQVNDIKVGEAKLRHLDVIKMGARSFRFEMAAQGVPESAVPLGNRAVGPAADEFMGTVDIPGEEATVLMQLSIEEMAQAGFPVHTPRVEAKSERTGPPANPVSIPEPTEPSRPAKPASVPPKLIPIPEDPPPAPRAPAPQPPPPPAPPPPPRPPAPAPHVEPTAGSTPVGEETIRYEPAKRQSQLADLAYMCAEVRGVAQIAESLEPDEVVDLINQYLAFLIGILRRHGATLDRFTGDSIRAFWGAPESREDDYLRAVKCALALQAELPQFNRLVSPGGQHKVELAIALHAGEAVAGSLGWETSFNFTVVGEVLAVATHLGEKCRPGQTLITSSLQRKLKDHLKLHLLPFVELRGRSGPIAVFLVQGLGK